MLRYLICLCLLLCCAGCYPVSVFDQPYDYDREWSFTEVVWAVSFLIGACLLVGFLFGRDQ